MKNFFNKHKDILAIIFIVTLFVTIGSKNSPLYKFNDWYDANAFVTMGRGLLNGFIPYKDLFEQKGPILYFLYAFAALISDTTFIGAYLLEIISLSIFLYYVRKCVNLFYDNKYLTSYSAILMFTIITLKPFGHGGSAEELCLPFFMYSIYSFFKYLKDDTITKKEIIINGIMAGCILWIKYSLLGFHFILAASLFFISLSKKKIKEAFLNCVYFLLGMLIVTIPVAVFFIINDALKSVIDIYFLVNMTSYANESSALAKIGKSFGLLFYNLVSNIGFLILILIPGIYYLFKRNEFKNKYAKWIILVSFLFMGLGTFIGGTNYFYYSFIITPFMILGVLLINRLLNRYKIEVNFIKNASLILGLLILVILISDNMDYLLKSKSEYAQYEFAKIINASDDKSILNYEFLDGGFYLTTETLPDCYYFMRNNFSYENYPIMLDTQNAYIKEKRPHYVVTRDKKDFLDKENYRVIASFRQKYEGKYVVYYLYER